LTRHRLTLCVIARDEARALPACLASARDSVDDMVVVDTGSRDATGDVAREAGARVVLHDWQDDFAAARNAAIGEVEDGYLLILDADELLAAGAGEAIRASLQQGGFDVGLLPLHHADTPDAPPEEVLAGSRRLGDPVLLPRLLLRTPELRFEGRVHESVGSWARGRPTRTVDAPIVHYGACPAVRAALGKDARNLRLLELRAEAEPDEPTVRAYLARELQRAGRREEALRESLAGWQALCRAREQGDHAQDPVLPVSVHAHLLLEAGRLAELVRVLQDAAEAGWEHPNLWFLAGVAAEQLALRSGAEADLPGEADLLGEAAACYRRCLGDITGPLPGEPIPGSRGWQAWTRLGTVDLRCGRGAEAERAFRAALAERPELIEARLGRAEARILRQRPEGALGLLEPLATEDAPDAWLLSALAALALGRRDEAAVFGRRAIELAATRGLCAPHRDSILRELETALGGPQQTSVAVSPPHPEPPTPVILAWPRYGLESEVDELFSQYGPRLADQPVRLFLVHDPDSDGDVGEAVTLIEAAYDRHFSKGARLDVEILSKSDADENLTALRELIGAVIDLPGSRKGARRTLLETIPAPRLDATRGHE
jgi:tetratricopeptide (TPR) repeat protein